MTAAQRQTGPFRAPWGEPERGIPYVVISTQPWPEEWWRPRPSASVAAARAAARATARPIEIVAMPREAGPVASPRPRDAQLPARAHIAELSVERARPRTRRARRQRSMFGRLALLAAGLVISLIAAEAVSRRRR